MNRYSINELGDLALVTWLADLGRSTQSSCKLFNDPIARRKQVIYPLRATRSYLKVR